MRLEKVSITLLSVLLLCSCTKTVQDKVQEPVIEDTQQEAAELSEAQTENKEEQTEETEEEAQEEVGEKQTELPEHQRPTGYDDPVLTKEVAKEILLEAREMQIRLFDGGLYSGPDSYNDISLLDSMATEIRVYYDFEADNFDPWVETVYFYIPALDTYEKFNDYFLHVLTDETVAKMITDYQVIEIDGRLGIAGAKYSGTIFERAWSKAEVLEVEQQEGSDVATVKALVHSSDSGIPIEMEYTLEFSEKYGWRVNLEDFHEGM